MEVVVLIRVDTLGLFCPKQGQGSGIPIPKHEESAPPFPWVGSFPKMNRYQTQISLGLISDTAINNNYTVQNPICSPGMLLFLEWALYIFPQCSGIDSGECYKYGGCS